MLSALKQLSWVDAAALAAVAFLMIRGFVRGCSGELGRLVAVVSAAALGFCGFAPVARTVLAAKLFSANPHAGKLVAFILLFVVCVALWLALGRLLSEAIRLVLPQPYDAILGGVIGGAKAFVLVAVLCTFGLLNPNEGERARFEAGSVTAKQLAPLVKRWTAPGPEG